MFSPAARLAAAVLPLAFAHSFIPVPQGTTVIPSTILPGASLSFKSNSFCDPTPEVTSYAGYVSLPVDDGAYNASIFFWYFTARHSPATAPTTLWLPGGPATSFLDGSSGFPCAVGDDGNSTTVNEFALNGRNNMLYVDIPVQAGYSYTDAANGTFDVVQNLFAPGEEVVVNASTTVASMSSQDPSRTANTTAQVAAQVWQFAQVWLQEFPNQANNDFELNMWSYSYSGFFGAAAAAYITEQNGLIVSNTYQPTAGIDSPVEIRLGTLGINNGCIDIECQLASFPRMLVNNSYGIKAVPDDVYEEAVALVDECYGLVAQCKAAATTLDPQGTGIVEEVNALCVNVTVACFDGLLSIYLESNVSPPPTFSHLHLEARVAWLNQNRDPNSTSHFPCLACGHRLESRRRSTTSGGSRKRSVCPSTSRSARTRWLKTSSSLPAIP